MAFGGVMSNTAPQWPATKDLLDAMTVPPFHPAVVDPQDLLTDCDLRTQRRSGPGGQHRNKTSSGVFLEHRPTGLIGEATERRSQHQNRDVALQRLRMRLAVHVRTRASPDDLWRRSQRVADIYIAGKAS